MGGDSEAFGQLFTRHRDRLWAVAVRTMGDTDEAADALQDAMVSAFRQAAGFRGDAAVTTWLHRIVVNSCLDRLRRRATRPVTTGLDEQAMDSLARTSQRTDETASAETSLEVAAALRALPVEQRSALVLVDMLGYAVADAAAVLGISVGTVKSRCARGRARLLPLLAHLRRTADGGVPAQPQGPARVPPDGKAAGQGQPGNRRVPGRVSSGDGGGETTL